MGTLRTKDESEFCENTGSTWRAATRCLPREKRRFADGDTLQVVRSAAGDAATSAAAAPIARKDAKPERATILVVENEQPIREMLRMYLEGTGYSVLEARDGDEALTLWETNAEAIDVVLTDWVMPGRLNGCQLVRQLQTSRPRLQAIIVSGQSAEAFEEECLLDGAKNFLPKPYRLNSLGAMVHNCVNQAAAASVETGSMPGRLLSFV